MTRPVCQAAIDLIKNAEGCRLEAYYCPAHIPTIGYGHTGPDVTAADVGDTTATQREAEDLLVGDLAKFASGVEHLVTVPTTDNQFGTLVSFAFNLGLGALSGSTLLRLLNAGDVKGASLEFGRWCHGGGYRPVTLPGLVKRREAERVLFLTPDLVGYEPTDETDED